MRSRRGQQGLQQQVFITSIVTLSEFKPTLHPFELNLVY